MDSQQKKNEEQNAKFKNKIAKLEEQVKKNQTPQMLGLLNEKDFLSEIKKEFPEDVFKHTGKKGDILHTIMHKQKPVGKIVYELKKVTNFNKDHIDQALKAKQQRDADFGILVTNAKRKKDSMGFSSEKGIFIIHPAGVMVLAGILRSQLIELSKLKLSKGKREQAVNNVMKYIQSSSFKNSVEGIIEDTKELYDDLQKEVKTHINTWEKRIVKYRRINTNADKIGTNITDMLSDKGRPKQLSGKTKIGSIELPEKIN